MRQYLGYVLFVQMTIFFMPLFTGQTNRLSYVANWLREQQELANEFNHLPQELIPQLLLAKQDAVLESPLSELSIQRTKEVPCLLLNLYREGFDKIREKQEQDVSKLREEEKSKLWQYERLNGEPERKRYRVE